MITSITTTSPGYFLLAFFLHIVGLGISVVRWQILLSIQNIHLSWRQLTLIYLEGFFFNTFLPGSVGGDIMRAYRASTQKLKSAAVILVERGTGILCLFIFVSFITLFMGRNIPNAIPLKPFLAPLSILLTFLIFSMFYFLIFTGKYENGTPVDKSIFLSRIKKFHETVKIYRNKRLVLLKILALSFLLQLNVVIHYYFIMKSLHIDIPISYAFFAIPLIHFILMLPISINGIGVRENIFAFMFTPMFATSATSIAIAWVAFGMVLVYALIGGIVHVLRKEKPLNP